MNTPQRLTPGANTLVTLDLKNTTQKQRDKFYASLAESGWLKDHEVTTTWLVSCSAVEDESSARHELERALATAAMLSLVEKYNATVKAGSLPTFDLEGGYPSAFLGLRR